MNVKFKIELTQDANIRLGMTIFETLEIDAEGTSELWDILAEKNIDEWDVKKIEVMGLSPKDHQINKAVLKLEEAGIVDIILGVPCDDLYLVASVLQGGLVQFQVSNGPPSNRDTSYDTYAYSEAKKIFDDCCLNGFVFGGKGPQG